MHFSYNAPLPRFIAILMGTKIGSLVPFRVIDHLCNARSLFTAAGTSKSSGPKDLGGWVVCVTPPELRSAISGN